MRVDDASLYSVSPQCRREFYPPHGMGLRMDVPPTWRNKISGRFRAVAV